MKMSHFAVSNFSQIFTNKQLSFTLIVNRYLYTVYRLFSSSLKHVGRTLSLEIQNMKKLYIKYFITLQIKN